MDLERNFIALADHKGDLLTRFDFKPTIQRFIESTEETGSSATILLHHDDSRVRVKSYLTHFPAMTIDGINKTVSACPCNGPCENPTEFIRPWYHLSIRSIYRGIGEDRVSSSIIAFSTVRRRDVRGVGKFMVYVRVLCLGAQWSHCDDRIDGFNSR